MIFEDCFGLANKASGIVAVMKTGKPSGDLIKDAYPGSEQNCCAVALFGWGYCEVGAGCVEAQHHKASADNAIQRETETGRSAQAQEAGVPGDERARVQ